MGTFVTVIWWILEGWGIFRFQMGNKGGKKKTLQTYAAAETMKRRYKAGYEEPELTERKRLAA